MEKALLIHGVTLRTIAGTDTAVIVTADHGLIDFEPGKTLWLKNHPQFAKTLTLPLCGERRAAYCYVHPERQAAFEHYVQTELAPYTQLFFSETPVREGYFGFGPSHPQLQERIGDYTLLMTAHYVIKDSDTRRTLSRANWRS